MIAVILCILSSSLLFFIFRIFQKYRIDGDQAIATNYIVAFTCGCFMNSGFPSFSELAETKLIPFVLIIGGLFVSMFIVMKTCSARFGMGVASVAVKMSIALSVVFFVFAYHEPVTWQKVTGFLLALAGIFFITYEKGNKKLNRAGIILLVTLFVGSAVIDILINYAQKKVLGDYPPALFSGFCFLAAGIFGTLWMASEYLRKKRTWSNRNLLGGLILGIPNYFSIYFLVRAYSTSGWADTTVLAVTGIGIVALSAIAGIIIFKESARWQKFAGLAAVAAAILLLTSVTKS